MRAVVITKPGGPDVLQVLERPTPVPSRGQLLVRNRASALNRADLLQREGHYPAPPGAPADIPGLEFAGEVAALGDGVAAEWTIGTRVFGITAGGGHAEYLAIDAGCCAPVPERFSWPEAGAIPEAFLTAHDALVTQAHVVSGERVLIHAVGSGVGLAAVQVARAWQAIPFGTARTADKIARAREFGLDHGIAVADPEEIVAPLEQWTGGKGVPIVLDLVGGAYVSANICAASPRGRIMCIGTVAGRTATIPVGLVLGKRLSILGTVLRSRSLDEKRTVTAAFARDIVPLLASGALRPTIDSVFDLDDVGEAHQRLAGNATFGKVVLRV